MSKTSLQLPESLKALIDEQMTSSGFQNATQYLEHLVRRDQQKRKAKAALEKELLKGLESGTPIRATEAYWAKKEKALTNPKRQNGGR
jgi:antitoxin ParD1/3/4